MRSKRENMKRRLILWRCDGTKFCDDMKKKQIDAALDEYDRMEAEARAEYDRVKAEAATEYNRVTDAALAEYNRVTPPVPAEYQRMIQKAAWIRKNFLNCKH